MTGEGTADRPRQPVLVINHWQSKAAGMAILIAAWRSAGYHIIIAEPIHRGFVDLYAQSHPKEIIEKPLSEFQKRKKKAREWW